MDMAFAIGAFAMFVIVWVGYAIALRGDRGFIDQGWEWLRGLPARIQATTWLFFLSIAVGMWIFESERPLTPGALLGVGMFAWTLVAVAGLVRVPRRRDAARRRCPTHLRRGGRARRSACLRTT